MAEAWLGSRHNLDVTAEERPETDLDGTVGLCVQGRVTLRRSNIRKPNELVNGR